VGAKELFLHRRPLHRAGTRSKIRGASITIEKKFPLVAAARGLKSQASRKRSGLKVTTLNRRLRSPPPPCSAKPCRLRPLSGAVERQRTIKDAAETCLIREPST